MAPLWTISVNGQIYGPYGLGEMRGFAAEGRLAGHSLVSRDGDSLYTPAQNDADLAPLFRANGQARPDFYTAEGDNAAQRFGRCEESEGDGEASRNHFLIVADMKAQSIAGLEEAIFKLGQACALTSQAWVLASDMPINAVRNALVQKLGRIDKLFLADASNNRCAWFNYGPESESRIRLIWQKAPDKTKAAG